MGEMGSNIKLEQYEKSICLFLDCLMTTTEKGSLG